MSKALARRRPGDRRLDRPATRLPDSVYDPRWLFAQVVGDLVGVRSAGPADRRAARRSSRRRKDMTPTVDDIAIWIISAVATAGVIVRPFKLPEAVWAVAGAAILLVLGLLRWSDGLKAAGKGTDVYLFLTGMMLLSEIARREGVFDWVASHAVNAARGSPMRLFTLIYCIGIVVTTFLSNDAAAVVLTPAVLAAAKKARADPLPLLFICAFIANAASFVLPISNPANLVLYGDHVPPLGKWLASFALPSFVSIVSTYVALRWVEGGKMGSECAKTAEQSGLSPGGKAALGGIGLTAVVLTTTSAFDTPLGLPTLAMGVLTAAAV